MKILKISSRCEFKVISFLDTETLFFRHRDVVLGHRDVVLGHRDVVLGHRDVVL